MNPRGWMLLLCLGVASPHAVAQASAITIDANADQADRIEHQILMMLRVPPPHYRAGASYGDSYRAPGREARRRIARSLARQHGLRLGADWPMPALGLDCFVLDVPQPDAVERVVRALETDARVESVQRMQRFRLLAGKDPLYPIQPAASDWHLAELHALTTGKGILVAIVDSGVARAHPDLSGQVRSMRNFVDDRIDFAETHGTNVAGIVAARANNGVGIVGIAPQASLLALRACAQTADGSASCSSFALASALQVAIDQQAQVLNMSLSGPYDRLLGRLLDAAMARGATVVAAVDAEAVDGGFPASHPGVLAVTGGDALDPPANALLAPGQDIPTTLPDNGWGMVTGASFAAAQVSGLVALLRQLVPRIDADRIRSTLGAASGLRSTPERPQPIDTCAVIRSVDGRCACNCAAASPAILATPRR